jgi:hypothetical protein
MNFRSISKAGTVLVGTALIAISGCVLYSFYVRSQAERCLKAVQQLHLGSSTEADAGKALGAFGRFERDGTAMILGKDYPLHTYRFKNNGFHLLGVFHPALFQASLTFKNGVLIERSASFFQEPYHTVITRESMAGLLQNASLDENPSGMIAGVYDPPAKMDVFLDTRASDTDRKAAYEYNLGCFTSLSGCRTVYEILPTVKQGATK